NIWAGTEGGGLCRLKPAIFETLGIRQGLSSDQVLSVCEAADGSYWIGMNGSGLDHGTPARVEHYGPRKGLLNGHVWSVVQDSPRDNLGCHMGRFVQTGNQPISKGFRRARDRRRGAGDIRIARRRIVVGATGARGAHPLAGG
ncbi:MAG: hypothetical protein IT579_11250, partial [Verrucomicrobia subdivision 3 bacterium]|nr:hypothetical protein [Limisphaerales bacterium]